MRKIFTVKEIKLQLLSFVLLLIATVSNAQFVDQSNRPGPLLKELR